MAVYALVGGRVLVAERPVGATALSREEDGGNAESAPSTHSNGSFWRYGLLAISLRIVLVSVGKSKGLG